MGSSNISPVLASFLSGQQGQTSLIQTAQSIIAHQNQQQNQAEERKQRQQELDDIMKRFDASHKLELDKNALAHQAADTATKLHLAGARQQFLENLVSGAEKPQQSYQSPTMAIPGLPQVSPDGGQSATPGIQIPNAGLPQLQNNDTQTLDSPFGQISVRMPQTALQSEVEKQKTLLPLKTKEAEELFKATKEPQYQAALDQKDRALANQKDIADLKAEVMRQGYEGRLSLAELNAQRRASEQLQQWGIPEDPEAARKMVAGYVHAQATGQGSGNPRQEYGPVIGGKVEAGLQASDFRTPPKGLRDTIMGAANDASRFLNVMDNFKDTVKAPKGLTGQISNIIADKTGISGLSPYKSQFDELQTNLVPSLDTALGLPAGALSRSPKLYDKIKSVAPLPGDKPDVIEKKMADGVDIYLSSISKKLAGLPAPQRAIFWQDIANDHPELINRNPGLRNKLFKAGNTGFYEPGELYKIFGGK